MVIESGLCYDFVSSVLGYSSSGPMSGKEAVDLWGLYNIQSFRSHRLAFSV